ncbi:hypothetical protein IWW36_002176 [Coemansia brasiliensis]|uniref:Uncharacterized protein n=1 Tax=Coemansia brasiliensis TaxID=2650707 RepID=A0A9W8I7J3_9FUNG|nr:hypothetical protein IWW36_002176 [Coemansia brasiliensis]
MKCVLLTYVAFLTSISAQFAFDVENTDKEAIYNDIEALWENWAAIGNQVLESAREKYPDAYNQLTSIYGTTSLPSDFDARAALNAAGILARSTDMTVWDQNAGDHAKYTFSVKDVEVGVGPTMEATTDSKPTEAVDSSSYSSDRETADEESSSETTDEESSSESSEELSGLESDDSSNSPSSEEESSESSLESEALDSSETTSGASKVVLPAMLVAIVAIMHIGII